MSHLFGLCFLWVPHVSAPMSRGQNTAAQGMGVHCSQCWDPEQILSASPCLLLLHTTKCGCCVHWCEGKDLFSCFPGSLGVLVAISSAWPEESAGKSWRAQNFFSLFASFLVFRLKKKKSTWFICPNGTHTDFYASFFLVNISYC